MSNINLLATQESVLKIFSTQEEIFIIPPYQRPYSWAYDAYKQLYDDITDAYLDNRDYFLGNMVVARGDDLRNEPEIVDGQQRILTLWMIIKVLSLLFPEMKRLSRILISESIVSDEASCKILSQVIENNDDEMIRDILSYTQTEVDILYSEFRKQSKTFNKKLKYGKLKNAFINIYNLFREFFNNLGSPEKKRDFITYFLNRVYLLPIELKGITVKDASRDALMIFETLNNRGQNLTDADIFKAELYRMAISNDAKDDFLLEWQDFRDSCKNLQLNLDDPFRYYYHIIRAQEGLTSSETNLRNFFMTNEMSPLQNSDYRSTMENLRKIVGIIDYLRMMVKGKGEDANNELAKWLQVLYAYTNVYPKFALVCYVYFKKNRDQEEFLRFVKTLIRFFYQTGSAITNVKYETASINKRTAKSQDYDTYYGKDSKGNILDNPGKLTSGLSLLLYYLKGHDFLENYYVNRILTSKELSEFNISQKEIGDKKPEYLLWNYFVDDISLMSRPFEERMEAINKTSKYKEYTDSDVNILGNHIFSKQSLLEMIMVRDIDAKNVLMDFFSGKV